jgi:3-aminobutyryl-CoA ammonia-lyase
MEETKTSLRIRIGWENAHYTAGLVAGGHLATIFGDAATVLMQMYDGDGGLLAGYDSMEFLKPIYAGDLLEIEAKIVKVGNTSRKIEFNAWKIIQTIDMGPYPSSAVVFGSPVLVGKAVGTIVVRKEKQWLHNQEMREKFKK